MCEIKIFIDNLRNMVFSVPYVLPPGDDGDFRILRTFAEKLKPGLSSKKKGWRPSGAEISDGFAKELTNIDELDGEQAIRIRRASDRGITVQGYIVRIVQGSRPQYYVVIDLIKYFSPTIIGALDLLVKLHLAYNVQYTFECEIFYQFIQKAIFKIDTKSDKPNTQLYVLLNEFNHMLKFPLR